ncbi:late competence development ComFB family protein [Oscillibacter sp.]|jgi:hypothetical protein|uniref:late competence development ComFB family protein n=1 Tax=Oscillibacter sp. TaxID=1945593 RepID=UPI00216FF480|nr:late competence development ComFB family protein [Oscillibacter sp.]MCI9239940.1 hypothetical protein [Oscillibacter sp.]
MASNNSSKTAHVMNLLSKNRGAAPEPPAEPKAEPAVPQAEPAPQAAPEAEPAHTAPVAPIISSITADAAVSSQIKDALEAELEAAPKAAPTAPASQAAPVPPSEPAPQAAPAQEAPAAPVREDVSQEPLQEEQQDQEEQPSYINVMQILVEEKADEYMKMFGICCCDKCRVDVRAYALNHLPSKYVVLSQNERVPRLTVYESRFASDVTSQLIQACKKVMLTPHHSRPEN